MKEGERETGEKRREEKMEGREGIDLYFLIHVYKIIDIFMIMVMMMMNVLMMMHDFFYCDCSPSYMGSDLCHFQVSRFSYRNCALPYICVISIAIP